MRSWLIFSWLISACSFGEKKEQLASFDLTNPSQTFELPKELDEISGISYMEEGMLAAVQDEKGFIYIYDTKNRKIEDRFGFSKNADYEDVVYHKGVFYVLRSDGTIYEYKEGNTREFDTFLDEKSDCEGLALDEGKNQLLIACKGKTQGVDRKKFRAVYGFDLGNKELTKDPLFLVEIKEHFKPSGLGINPKTNEIYLISSQGLLWMLDKDGKEKQTFNLNRNLFRQPEGITFSPNGELYISNEGKKGTATILFFK